jgi:hypothetical protein
MSVEVAPFVRRELVPTIEEPSSVTTIKYASRDYGSDIEWLHIRPARDARAPKKHESTEKILRRLQGFLVEDEGEEYKVAFVENDALVFYYLPASPMRKAGVAAPNQPFQMDEVEVQLSSGRTVTGYTFVPLAKPSDAFMDSTDLNEERRRKLETIFRKFGKARD